VIGKLKKNVSFSAISGIEQTPLSINQKTSPLPIAPSWLLEITKRVFHRTKGVIKTNPHG